jgi:hypothetical protein
MLEPSMCASAWRDVMGVSRVELQTTVRDLIMRLYGWTVIILMGLGYSVYGSAWFSAAVNWKSSLDREMVPMCIFVSH